MGFLKFLKREKGKESIDDLDLPPAPPPLEGFDDKDMGMDFPDIKMDDMSKDMPEFDFPDKAPENVHPDDKMDFEFDDDQIKMPDDSSFRQPMRQSVEPAYSEPQTESKPAPRIVQPSADFEPKHVKPLHEHARSRTMYVKVDKFRLLLGTINVVRSDLRKSDEALMKMESMKTNVDRSFDKMKSSLHDLQKKLIFVDKTLFKGD